MNIYSFSRQILVISLTLGVSLSASAYSDGSFSLGVGYYSQGIGKNTKSPSANSSLSGASSLPLLVRYEWGFLDGWFFAPQIGYTPIGRSSGGESTKTTMIQLFLPVGGLLTRMGSETTLDWAAGFGLINYQIKGKGGTKTMSNGTGSSVFAVPGRTVQVRTVVLDLGLAINNGPHRFGLDLVFEGLLSKLKRTESLMASYSYRFGGNKF